MRYKFPILHPRDAIDKGYVSLTLPYSIETPEKSIRDEEIKFFRNTLKDMEGCDCVLVEFTNGVEVWRHKRELNVCPKTGVKLSKSEGKINLRAVEGKIRKLDVPRKKQKQSPKIRK